MKLKSLICLVCVSGSTTLVHAYSVEERTVDPRVRQMAPKSGYAYSYETTNKKGVRMTRYVTLSDQDKELFKKIIDDYKVAMDWSGEAISLEGLLRFAKAE